MRKCYLPFLSLFCCLLLCLTGCTTETPDSTLPPASTTAAPTTEPTTVAPDPAEDYLAALELLGTDAVGMSLTATQTMTVAGQVFTSKIIQDIRYWNLGSEDLTVQVKDTTDLGAYAYKVEELYGNGMLYQTINDCLYSAQMDAEAMASRYPSIQLLDPSLYTVTVDPESGDLLFTDATAPEAWLADPEEAELNSAEATVSLSKNGAITLCTYTVDYTYGTAHYVTEYTVKYLDPGEAPALPEDTSGYAVVEDIDGIWFLDIAYGYLLQAKQYSSQILTSTQSQAAGMVLNMQYSLDTQVTDSGKDYRVSTSIYAMDQSGNYESEMDEKFIGGKYTASADGGEETPNAGVTASMMDTYISNMLQDQIFDTPFFTDAEITDLGSLYLVEYTCTEELALTICEDINNNLFGDPDTLANISSAYKTNKLDYYLSLDKYSLLPVAAGYLYEGCHTIDGYECLLIEQYDQSFDLASLTAYEAIHEEPSPDTEPENKPTPLFYRVTGSNGQEMWLFGTIHVGDDRTGFLPQEITDALLSSDALAVECDTDAFEKQVEEDEALQEQVSGLYYYSGTTIADHLVTEELYEDAVKAMKATGSYFYNSEYQKASLWSNSIDNYYLAQGHSLISEKGVESRLEKLAEDNNIPLREVESSLFQIKMMTGYSDELQEFQLYSSAHTHGKDYWESTQELYELWCAGDEAALIEEMARESWELTEEDFEETEDMTEEDRQKMEAILADLDNINPQLETIRQEYLKAMEIDRNAGMLEVAKQYLESGETVFYAVGLAHLLAEDGLVFTLREAGYAVELVEYK